MSFLGKLIDYAASRHLRKRGAQHARSGAPPIATFAFDHIGHEINLRGRYEADELECAIGFLRGSALLAGDVVDVGANIGNHALFFSEHYDRVIAIDHGTKIMEGSYRDVCADPEVIKAYLGSGAHANAK